jgi:AcrR family transcriptional regulator
MNHGERQSPGRAEILTAAARAFAEHGYHGMSMRDLAKATHRSPATLYNYVDSKEDLLYWIQRDAFDELIASARSALEGVTDENERLHAFVLAHVRFFANRQHWRRVLIHEAAALPAPRRREIRARKETYFRIAEDIVAKVAAARDGVEPDAIDVERNTYCLFGMLNWTYGWYDPDRHGATDELARTIVRVAVSGLASRAEPHGTRKDRARTERKTTSHEARAGGAR